MPSRKPIFVVGDLETTGLDAKRDVILEAAFAVTDAELNVIDSKSWLVLSPDWNAKVNVNLQVLEMHQKSGLIRDLRDANSTSRTASKCGITSVSNDIYNWLFDHGIQGKHPLMGSTIGFDRKFLAEHMPQVESCFSYRSIDVSSIKELCKVLNPNVYAEYEKIISGRVKPHRASRDVAATLEELEFYMNEFLMVDFERIMDGQEELNLS